MRVKSKTKDFRPFDITITMESEEDAKMFHAIFNNSINTKHIGTNIALDIIHIIEKQLNDVENGVDDSDYYEDGM